MSDCPESLIVPPQCTTSGLDLHQVFGEKPGRLEVDIGCGKGRFLVARAQSHPDTRFLGIEKRMTRVCKVARKAARAGLSNVRLMCAEARGAVADLLPSRSVNCYYLFFPDPWPKRRHHRRRLFDREFVIAMEKTMAEKGEVHIITDHREYFEIMRGILSEYPAFAAIPSLCLSEEERTEFQMVFMKQAAPLYSCSFRKTRQT